MLISHYKYNFAKVLSHVFPEIGLDKGKLDRLPSIVLRCLKLIPTIRFLGKFWAHPTNQKLFFTTFAAESKFDPLIPRNWYNVNPDSLYLRKASNFISTAPET